MTSCKKFTLFAASSAYRYNPKIKNFMKTQPALKEQAVEQLSQEALQILDLLDKIENHTADLRKKLMSELKKNGSTVHLKLDSV